MKKLFLLAFLACAISAFAQDSVVVTMHPPDFDKIVISNQQLNEKIDQIIENNYNAGFHLKKASYMWYAGTGCIILGTAISAIGAIASSSGYYTEPAIWYAAGGVFLAGAIGCYVCIPINWHKSGIHLQKK